MADQVNGAGYGNVSVPWASWLVGGLNYALGKLAFGTGRTATDVDDVAGARLPVNPHPAPLAPTVTPAASAHLVAKAAAGEFFGAYATVTVAGYLMVFDANEVPPDGAVTPKECAYCAGGPDTVYVDLGGRGDQYATGIVVVYSTTGPYEKTEDTSNTAFLKARVL